jgi:hypothetical protein
MTEFSGRDILLALAAIIGLTVAGAGVLMVREAGNWAVTSVVVIGIVGMLLGWLLFSVPNPRRMQVRNRRRRGRPSDLA